MTLWRFLRDNKRNKKEKKTQEKKKIQKPPKRHSGCVQKEKN